MRRIKKCFAAITIAAMLLSISGGNVAFASQTTDITGEEGIAIDNSSTETTTETTTEDTIEDTIEDTTEDSAVEDGNDSGDDIENTSTEEDEDLSNGELPIDFENQSVTDGASENTAMAMAAAPSSYDLRNYNKVTSVKNQGAYKTCWAFASMASLESSAINKGISSIGNTDYSEYQIAYFMYNRVTDPLGKTGNDGVDIISSEDYTDYGGNIVLAAMNMSKWVGAAQESTCAYSNMGGVLSNQYAYRYDTVHLENSYWVSMEDMADVKNCLMTYGAGAMSLCISITYRGQDGYSYYCPIEDSINHAVTLVGWDDNYSKYNFKNTPEGNGAWLCKNSYGDDGVNGGYIWISYYDATIYQDPVVFNVAASAGNYDNNYQYDGGVGIQASAVGYYDNPDPVSKKMANVYTADSSEALKAVSFYTCETNVGYSVEVYKLNTGATSPVEGTLMSTKNGYERYMGYHTINLDNTVGLNAGDNFSVVVTLYRASGRVSTMIDISNYPFGSSTPIYSYASANKGESYAYDSYYNRWGALVVNGSYSNYRIKAFTDERDVARVDVSYNTHVQSKGWTPAVSNGTTSGTTGSGLRLEGIKIKLNTSANLGVKYSTHIQTYGWGKGCSNDGGLSGTTGESKRLEAIKIQLTGADVNKFDIYYRVHAQSYGWLGWAKNGEVAGTAGLSKRLEAIQIIVVPKGDGIGGPEYYSYVEYGKSAKNSATAGLVNYSTHVQSYGNQSYVSDGSVSGTFGEGKRLEGIRIQLGNTGYSGGVQYASHVQTYGWNQGWVSDGALSGTSGQSKRLEAIMIKLTGNMQYEYDIYYRVHAQTYGWLAWAKNGEMSGTAGLGKRLEAIQIVLVPKRGTAPSSSGSISQKYISK